MHNLLQLTTSLFDGPDKQGVSSQLSDELIAGLQGHSADLHVNTRNFSASPIPYFDHGWLQALSTPATDRSDGQNAKVAYSDSLIAELQAADTVVIGVPMYNFAIPAMLKSWTDHIARAGVTFSYGDKGPVGLVTGKKVYVVLATGGKHEEGVTDHLRPFLRTFLGFVGMTDIEFIVADGLNLGEAARQEGLQQARSRIEQLLADYAAHIHEPDIDLVQEQAA
jgi:FMN-dependent NADH-azoreductase